jgi:hypothetical protein
MFLFFFLNNSHVFCVLMDRFSAVYFCVFLAARQFMAVFWPESWAAAAATMMT